MTRKNVHFGVALFAVFALLLAGGAGCDSNEDSAIKKGSLKVTWQLGARSCSDFGIEGVQVNLYGENGALALQDDTRCEDRELVLTGVPVGVYLLELLGSNSEGKVTHRAFREDVSVRNILETREHFIGLEVIGASLTLKWRFDNGELCVINGVVDVLLDLYESETSWSIHKGTYSCEQATTTVYDIKPGSTDVVAYGVDENDQTIFMDVLSVTLQAGEDATESLVLNYCSADYTCY